MIVVVSQPMFLPWIGLFEQARLADRFVHYDDVQLPQGRNFITRVQIKTPAGTQWLSVSIDRGRSGKTIAETHLVGDGDWRERHLSLLREHYRSATHAAEMLELAESIYGWDGDNLADLNIFAFERIARWLGLEADFVRSSALPVAGSGSERLLGICNHFEATEYLTGHGAANYLDHQMFESAGIGVSYMDYALAAYPQLHGEFIPYVSILDAIANTGAGCRELLTSATTDWRAFLRTRA